MKIRYIFSIAFAFSSFFLWTGSPRAQLGETENGETLAQPVSAPSDSGIYKGINELPESIRQSAPFARALDQMARRAGTAGVWDEEARVKAFEQSRQDLNQSAAPAEKSAGSKVQPFANTAWTNIGLTGSANNNVFSAGCTTTIAIDPTNTQIMYVGGTSGGVWKSTNSGANWAPLTDTWIPNQSIASIAIDPKNHNTLYVGTGNGFASIDELTGTGLWKSTDGGGTWNHIGASTLSGTIVKVLVDPVKSNVIFALSYTSNRGVYRSTDSGVTWTKTYTAAQPVWDMVAGTVLNGVPELYFAEGNNPGGSASECGLYKSGNDGVTWSKIAGNLPAGDSIGRCALAVSVAHPERLFVLMANPNGDIINELRSLFRSTNNGANWTAIEIPSTLFIATNPMPQGWYDCTLAVSPSSQSGADTMLIGGIEAWVNYGSGWQPYSGNFNGGQDAWPTSVSHVDHHAIAFNPSSSNIVYDGCDGGLYWSQDWGFADTNSTTTSWSYRSNQMTTNRIYHMGLDPVDSKTTFVGLQDQGTWSLVDGRNAVFVGGGDGIQPLSYSANSSNPFYYELPQGDIYDHNNNFLSGNFTDGANWDTPLKMAIVPYNGVQPYHVLYAGRQHLWISTDDGNDWSMNSATFQTSDNNDPFITSLGLSHASSNIIYVGAYAQISVTTNGGTTWATKTSGMPAAIVTSIVTTARNTNFALASFYSSSGNRVMRTTNQGSTWVNASGGTGATLPMVGVSCVALDSISPLSIWYAATDNGIYYTLDTGAHWSVAGAGIGLVSCSDVEVQANKTTIRVATFGRGIWEGNTGTLPIELASFTYQKQLQNNQPIGTILNWITDSEDGTSYFEIDRSIGGASFEEITQVPTKAPGGTSSTQLDYGFFDSTHTSGEYIYQLKEIDLDGSVHASNIVELNWGVSGLIVSQNYPNPFLIGTPPTTPNNTNAILGTSQPNSISPWPVTRFHYELPNADVVTLKIYNSTGALVRTLLDQVQQQPGDPDAFWDGRDESGTFLPSGTYFYVIETQNSGTVVNKMILLSN